MSENCYGILCIWKEKITIQVQKVRQVILLIMKSSVFVVVIEHSTPQ